MDTSEIYFHEANIETGQHKTGLAISSQIFFNYFRSFLNPSIQLIKKDSSRTSLDKGEIKLFKMKDLEKYDWSSYLQLFKNVVQASKENKFCINFGGDHSFSLASISGLLKKHPNLGIIWMDAHADMNSLKTTQTGRLHGMTLSFLLGLQKLPSPLKKVFINKIKSKQIVMIGLRDLDPGEIEFIKELKIKVFSNEDLKTKDSKQIIKETLSYLGKRPLHLSFDFDCLDPKEGGLVSVPSPNGLSKKMVLEMISAIGKTQNLVSLDVAEINPCLAKNSSELIESYIFIAKIINQLMAPNKRKKGPVKYEQHKYSQQYEFYDHITL